MIPKKNKSSDQKKSSRNKTPALKHKRILTAEGWKRRLALYFGREIHQ